MRKQRDRTKGGRSDDETEWLTERVGNEQGLRVSPAPLTIPYAPQGEATRRRRGPLRGAGFAVAGPAARSGDEWRGWKERRSDHGANRGKHRTGGSNIRSDERSP